MNKKQALRNGQNPDEFIFCMIFERICDILEKHTEFQSYLL